MSSQDYKETQAVRLRQRCEETVVRDGQRGFCDRPVVDAATGLCDRPSDHEEG